MKAKLARGQQWVYELLSGTSTAITAQEIFAELQIDGRSRFHLNYLPPHQYNDRR